MSSPGRAGATRVLAGQDDALLLVVINHDNDHIGLSPLRVFGQSVKHGRVERICEKSYVPLFSETLADLISRCTGPAIPE